MVLLDFPALGDFLVFLLVWVSSLISGWIENVLKEFQSSLEETCVVVGGGQTW